MDGLVAQWYYEREAVSAELHRRMINFMRMGRITWFLLGALGTGLILGSVHEFATPPAAFLIGMGVILIAPQTWFAARTAKNSVRLRRALGAFSASSPNDALALRLLGDYSPYTIEAAQELGSLHEGAAVPLLIHAIERLTDEKPAGWREMTSGMVEALVAIGDPQPLGLLRRIQRIQGAEEIASLPGAIAALEHVSELLRPANPEMSPEVRLLRPTQTGLSNTEQSLLLRPGEGIYGD